MEQKSRRNEISSENGRISLVCDKLKQLFRCLQARQDIGNAVRYVCQTCPYIYSVDREMSKKVTVARKEVDDVLGGEDTWRTAQRSENSSCPNCGHYESYFFEMQTRSADEPMSIFHKCLKCSSHWKE